MVTVMAEVVVEVEVEARSAEEAEAKADEWYHTHGIECGTVSGYWIRSDGESDYCDDKFDVVWEVVEVPYHECVRVEELDAAE